MKADDVGTPRTQPEHPSKTLPTVGQYTIGAATQNQQDMNLPGGPKLGSKNIDQYDVTRTDSDQLQREQQALVKEMVHKTNDIIDNAVNYTKVNNDSHTINNQLNASPFKQLHATYVEQLRVTCIEQLNDKIEAMISELLQEKRDTARQQIHDFININAQLHYETDSSDKELRTKEQDIISLILHENQSIIDQTYDIIFTTINFFRNDNLSKEINKHISDQLIEIISQLPLDIQKEAIQEIVKHIHEQYHPFDIVSHSKESTMPGFLRNVMHTLQNIHDNPNVLIKLNDINNRINTCSDGGKDKQAYLNNLKEIFHDIFIPPYQPANEGSCFASCILMKIWHDDLPSFIDMSLNARGIDLSSLDIKQEAIPIKFSKHLTATNQLDAETYSNLSKDKRLLYTLAPYGRYDAQSDLTARVNRILKKNNIEITQPVQELVNTLVGNELLWNAGWMPVCAQRAGSETRNNVLNRVVNQLSKAIFDSKLKNAMEFAENYSANNDTNSQIENDKKQEDRKVPNSENIHTNEQETLHDVAEQIINVRSHGGLPNFIIDNVKNNDIDDTNISSSLKINIQSKCKKDGQLSMEEVKQLESFLKYGRYSTIVQDIYRLEQYNTLNTNIVARTIQETFKATQNALQMFTTTSSLIGEYEKSINKSKEDSSNTIDFKKVLDQLSQHERIIKQAETTLHKAEDILNKQQTTETRAILEKAQNAVAAAHNAIKKAQNAILADPTLQNKKTIITAKRAVLRIYSGYAKIINEVENVKDEVIDCINKAIKNEVVLHTQERIKEKVLQKIAPGQFITAMCRTSEGGHAFNFISGDYSNAIDNMENGDRILIGHSNYDESDPSEDKHIYLQKLGEDEFQITGVFASGGFSEIALYPNFQLKYRELEPAEAKQLVSTNIESIIEIETELPKQGMPPPAGPQ